MVTYQATADNLDSLVEFDVPFRVEADGQHVTDRLPMVYAPSVSHVSAPHPKDIEIDSTAWSVWSVGRSNQHGYNGGVMHASEWLGGGMAVDLLAEPGTYVVCAVEVVDCADDCAADCDGEHEPAGWVVLQLNQ